MRFAVLAVFLAAACGSKSAAPAAEPAPTPDPVSADEPDPDVPPGCDQYCADGCAEVEDYDLCMMDCGCGETPCDPPCYGGCMSQGRPEDECIAECGCAEQADEE